MIKPEPYRHKYTYNNLEVPGVTTILGVVAKPQLIPWANNLGLKGIKVADYNANVTGIGTLTHAYLEGILTNKEVDDSSYTDEQRAVAQACRDKFVDWKSKHNVGVIATELSINGREFGGTLDAILEVDGVNTIVDFKTSKDVYPEYFAQLAAYVHLYEYSNLVPQPQPIQQVNIDQVAVLQVSKEVGEAQYVPIDRYSGRFTNAMDYFFACMELYYKKKVLK